MATIDVIDAATGLPWRAPPPWSQLVLPGVDLPVDCWDVIVAGPERAVRVRAIFDTDGLELSISDREPDERAMVVAGHASPEELLVELTVPLRGSGFASGWCFRQPIYVDGWSLGPDDWGPRGVLGRIGSAVSVHIGAGKRPPALLTALLADISDRVTHLCDPRAAAAARAVHRSIRLAVHALVADDSTGRLAQLAKVAPGVLTMMASRRGRDAVPLAVSGEPLRAVADAVVASAWPDIGDRAGALRQRRWLLAAPAALDPVVLDRVAPSAVPLDDIPTLAPDATAFYEVIAAVTDELGHDDDIDDGTTYVKDPLLRRGFLRFASRHAVAIRGLEDWDERLELVMIRALQTGAYPTRRAPLAAWLPTETRTATGARLLGALDGPLGKVVRLDTQRALNIEAEEMHHCVDAYAGGVASGHLVVLRLETQGHRATLALSWDPLDRVFRPTDFAGPGNQRPTAPVVALARAYAEANPGLVVGEIPPAKPCA